MTLRTWRIVAAVLVVGAACAVATWTIMRWDRGLSEDRTLYKALGYARAAARLCEAHGGRPNATLTAYGNSVGQGDAEVLRMVVVGLGQSDDFGVRRGARTLWSMHGHHGKLEATDQAVAGRANHLAAHFRREKKGAPIPLVELVEISHAEDGQLRTAAYAPITVNQQIVGLAAVLLRVPEPVSEWPSAIWLLAVSVLGVFVFVNWLLPDAQRLGLLASFVALGVAVAVTFPAQINQAKLEHLSERAADWLAVQAHADSLEPLALAAPIADREMWSHDGALRLERQGAQQGPDALKNGAVRVGNARLSVHLHPDIHRQLTTSFSPTLAFWALAVALLMALAVGPIAKLLLNLTTQPGVYAYVAPAVLGLLILVFLPFVTGVGLSFYRYHLVGNAYEWVGMGNFAEIVAPGEMADIHFWRTLGVTLLWTALNVILHVAIGLGLALLLNRPGLKGRGWYRVLLILPWAVPSYITALMWRFMFLGHSGPANSLLGWVGLGPVSWFDDGFWTNFIPNLVTNTWLGFPFMMVVALGALQSIPTDLYEAARLDGASAWQRFRHVTLPLLKPALLPAVILGTIWTFNLFNVIYLVSMGAGNTEILITEAYRAFHEQHRHGYAAGYSVLIFVVLLAYTMVTVRITKANQEVPA